jgi:hypothetical protein
VELSFIWHVQIKSKVKLPNSLLATKGNQLHIYYMQPITFYQALK